MFEVFGNEIGAGDDGVIAFGNAPNCNKGFTGSRLKIAAISVCVSIWYLSI